MLRQNLHVSKASQKRLASINCQGSLGVFAVSANEIEPEAANLARAENFTAFLFSFPHSLTPHSMRFPHAFSSLSLLFRPLQRLKSSARVRKWSGNECEHVVAHLHTLPPREHRGRRTKSCTQEHRHWASDAGSVI